MNTFNKYTVRGLWLAGLLISSFMTGCNSAYTPTPVTTVEPSATVVRPADGVITDNTQVIEGSTYANTKSRARPMPPTNLTVK